MLYKKDILFFVEHKDRELDISQSISRRLTFKYNFKSVIISQIFDSFLSIFIYIPKVIVTPTTSFSKGSVGWLYYKIYGERIEYISLNYEQFLGSWESASKLKFSKVTQSYQKHFAWGLNFKNILISNNIPESNIFITGRPLDSLVKNKYSDRKKNN